MFDAIGSNPGTPFAQHDAGEYRRQATLLAAVATDLEATARRLPAPDALGGWSGFARGAFDRAVEVERSRLRGAVGTLRLVGDSLELAALSASAERGA